MGWESSDRRARLPADWAKRRAAVLKRDGYQCTHVRWDTEQRCAEPATECDHVKPGDNHSYENLQSLCGYHHAQKTARESAQARARERYARPSRRRPDDDHPSVIK